MRVKIVSGGVAAGTKITDEEGRELDWVTAVTWRAEVDDICRAQIELGAMEVEVEGEATFYVKGKPVRRIEYADGTVDEYPGA